MTTPVAAPVVFYPRIGQNRHRTIILTVAAVLIAIPFVIGVSLGVAQGIVWQVSHQAHLNRFHEIRMRRLQERYDDIAHHRLASRDLRKSMDATLQADLKTANQYTSNESATRLEITAIVAVGLTAVLGLLIWGFASSATSKLLVMFGARPAGANEACALEVLQRVARAADLPPPALYIIESLSVNAFAAGLTPGTAVIAVTRGLLELLDPFELEGVLAHELSHIGNRDTALNVIVLGYTLLLQLPGLLQHRPIRQDFARTLALLPVSCYVLLIAPALSALIRSAISPDREFQADNDAAHLTGYPGGLMCALAKIATAGAYVAGSDLTISHLYFADPGEPGEPNDTHPPIHERLMRLADMDGSVSGNAILMAGSAGRHFLQAHPAPARAAKEEVTPVAVAARTALNPRRIFGIVPAHRQSIRPPSEPRPGLSAILAHAGLSPQQAFFCAGFALLVFIAMLMLLLQFGAR